MSLGSNCGPTLLAMFVFGHWHAVNQPADLVASAHVQLVVRHIGARDIISDRIQAVRAVGARRVLDVLPIHERRRRHRRGMDVPRAPRDGDGFAHPRNVKLEVQHGRGVRHHRDQLLHRVEALNGHRHGVVANRHRRDLKCAFGVRHGGLRPVGLSGLDGDDRTRHRPVLRIMHDAFHGRKHRSKGGHGEDHEQANERDP